MGVYKAAAFHSFIHSFIRLLFEKRYFADPYQSESEGTCILVIVVITIIRTKRDVKKNRTSLNALKPGFVRMVQGLKM